MKMEWHWRILYWQVMMIVTILLDMIWAFPIKWAWNYVMPYLFKLPTITWLHSWLLLFVIETLWKQHISVVQEVKKD
jgi:hypothetical protein